MVERGEVWLGKVEQVEIGPERWSSDECGAPRWSRSGKERKGSDGYGRVWCSKAVQVRSGMVR